MKTRFDVDVDAADGSSNAEKTRDRRRQRSDPGGRQGGYSGDLGCSCEGCSATCSIAADVNAVPPSGIEGVKVNSNGDPLEATKAVGIGALAIGNVKYKTEFGLFKKMIEAEKTVSFDFQDAFSFARELAK